MTELENRLTELETTGLTEISVDEGVTALGARLFAGNTQLRRVNLPASVKTIGVGAFAGCTALEEVSLQEGLRRLGDGCFENCTALKEVTLPETVVSIRSGAFRGCTGLEKINLPEALRRNVESETFAGCAALESIEVPSQVQSIMPDAFRGCVNLKTVRFRCEGVRVSASSFAGCESLPAETMERIRAGVPDRFALNIRSTASGTAGRLSNFTARRFVFDGVECGSIEGVLQAFKCPDPQRQAEICRLSGSTAKHAGSGFSWREQQQLYWLGEVYPRRSEAYQQLLIRLYDAVYAQDEAFRADILEIRGAKIDHSMGHSNPTVSVLTREEFLNQLRRLAR